MQKTQRKMTYEAAELGEIIQSLVVYVYNSNLRVQEATEVFKECAEDLVVRIVIGKAHSGLSVVNT